MILLTPKYSFSIDPSTRVYFLAGPIRGGDSWQESAVDYLLEHDSDCVIVCPYNFPPNHKYYKYCRFDTLDEYTNQTLWERYYMQLASRQGCIIFWLPAESKTNPRTDGQYARDTRGEIREWAVRTKLQRDLDGNSCSVKVVFGVESNFPGYNVLKTNLEAVLGLQILYSSLKLTLNAAIHQTKHI